MIVKFCKRKHNPFIAETTIQLCTLSYYKSADNDFIRDIDEGRISRSYRPSEATTYTGSEIGKIAGLPISGNGTIRFQGKALGITNSIPNAYIFCTSYLQKPTLSDAALLGYDSFYVVKEPDLLGTRIAQEVQRIITGQPEVLAFHGHVRYQENKEVIFSHLPTFFQSQRVIHPYLYLLKRHTSREDPLKVYANDNEHRFVFIPIDKLSRPIPLTAEKIYVDANVVKDVLTEVG